MIVVTTPTGAIGRQLVANLLDSPEPIRVIARDPSRLPPQVLERVEVVRGSHGDAEVLDRAFAGADAVFWLVAADPSAESAEAAYVDFTRPACEAFRKHGVSRVVAVSALGRGTAMAERAGHVTASLKMDDLIASVGVSFRELTLPGFMDNMLRQVEPIRTQGVFFWPIRGDLKAPTCATRDIAAAAAKLLLDPSWSGRGHVAVLGPEDLSFNEMAQIMSDVLGKPVRFQEMPMEALQSRLIGGGYSPGMAQAMIDMMAAKNEGLDNAEPRTPQSTSPTSFRQWCEDVLKPAVLG
jgi:uncharacterized protein YbjT (DUF2867 family)